jgi:heptosyltransferase III
MARDERGSRVKRALDRWIGCPAVWLLGLARRRRACPSEVERIGILMYGAIGDALLASSIIHDLRERYPTARIVAFVSETNRDALDLVEGPDACIVTPIGRPLRVIAILQRHKFDILIDVGQWPRISALVAALADARFTVGFKTPGEYRHQAFDAVAEHSAHRHEIENFRALLGCLGIRSLGVPRFKRALLQGAIQPGRDPYVVFHPWASGYRSHLREWPTANWIRLASMVLSHGFGIIITGAPQDLHRAEILGVAIAGGRQVDVLAGRATLRETAQSLLNAAAVVSVNTGIMHISALLGRPTIALHGPTNPRRWGPLGESCTVIGPGPECGCGYLNLGFEYPAHPPDCMGRISVEEVSHHLGRMLDWQHAKRSSTTRSA